MSQGGEAPPRAKEKTRRGIGCLSWFPGPSSSSGGGDGRRQRTDAVPRQKKETVVATLGYHPSLNASSGGSQRSLPVAEESAPPPHNVSAYPLAEPFERTISAPNTSSPLQADGAEGHPQSPPRDAPPPIDSSERTPTRPRPLGGTLASLQPAGESGAEDYSDPLWDEIPDMVVVAGASGGEAKGPQGAAAEDHPKPFSPTIDGLQHLDLDDDPPSQLQAASARAAAGARAPALFVVREARGCLLCMAAP